MGETGPGGRIDRIPKEFRGAHSPLVRPETKKDLGMDSVWRCY